MNISQLIDETKRNKINIMTRHNNDNNNLLSLSVNKKKTYLEIRILIFADYCLTSWLVLAINNIHIKSPFVSFEQRTKSLRFIGAFLQFNKKIISMKLIYCLGISKYYLVLSVLQSFRKLWPLASLAVLLLL